MWTRTEWERTEGFIFQVWDREDTVYWSWRKKSTFSFLVDMMQTVAKLNCEMVHRCACHWAAHRCLHKPRCRHGGFLLSPKVPSAAGGRWPALCSELCTVLSFHFDFTLSSMLPARLLEFTSKCVLTLVSSGFLNLSGKQPFLYASSAADTGLWLAGFPLSSLVPSHTGTQTSY